MYGWTAGRPSIVNTNLLVSVAFKNLNFLPKTSSSKNSTNEPPGKPSCVSCPWIRTNGTSSAGFHSETKT